MFFFISVVGLLSISRIFYRWKEKKVITQVVFKKSVIVLLLANFLLILVFKTSFVLVWAILIIENSILFFVPTFIEMKRKAKFKKTSVFALDAIVLTMKSGKSFRDSVTYIRSANFDFGFYFEELFDALIHQQSIETFAGEKALQRFYSELYQISLAQNKVIERIQSLRHCLRAEIWFEEKTKRVLAQARAQSAVLTLMYVFVSVFVGLSSGFLQNLNFFSVSIGFFAVGMIWIWRLGGNYKWKT